MSKLITNTIRHTAGSADNITLDNSQNVTVEGNLTVDGTLSGVSLGAALTGSTDNTICTVTGSNAIQGEADLQWDGTSLKIKQNNTWIRENQFRFNCAGAGHIDHYTNGQDINFRVSTSSGADTTAFIIKSNGNTLFGDSRKAIFGVGEDLQIDHTSGVNHIRSHNGDLVIGTQNNHTTILGQYYGAAGGGDTLEIWGGANVVPATNDAVDLGETNHKWDDIYATNSSIQTSDQNIKDNITASDLGLSFINKLSPKSYKFKGKTRTHYGLIAQDIETVLGNISKPTADFAGFIKTPAPEQLYTERDEAHSRIPSGKAIGDVKLAAHTDYGLRYNEFISPLIKAVQELSAEVETLKTKVATLEAA